MSNGIHIVGQRSRPRSKAPQEGPLWFPIPRLNVMAHPASLEVDVRRDDLRAGESQAATGVLVPRSDDFAHVGLHRQGGRRRATQLMAIGHRCYWEREKP